MSFVTVLALGLSLLVLAPTLAHLLRRGRANEQPFPPAGLVPAARATARERSRLEDRGVLLLRALMILCMALLGAGPLVRCSRVALGRSRGASVPIAIGSTTPLACGRDCRTARRASRAPRTPRASCWRRPARATPQR